MVFYNWLFGRTTTIKKTEKEIETDKKIKEIKEEQKRIKVFKKNQKSLPLFKEGTTPEKKSIKQKDQLKKYNLRNKNEKITKMTLD